MPRKEVKDQGTEGETQTPSWANDVLIDDEEQNGKQKRIKKKKKIAVPQASYPRPFSRLQWQEGKTSEKSEEKGTEAQRMKPPTPTWAIDALIGDKEHNEKQNKKKKETEQGPPTQIPWALRSPSTTHKDPTVSLSF